MTLISKFYSLEQILNGAGNIKNWHNMYFEKKSNRVFINIAKADCQN